MVTKGGGINRRPSPAPDANTTKGGGMNRRPSPAPDANTTKGGCKCKGGSKRKNKISMSKLLYRELSQSRAKSKSMARTLFNVISKQLDKKYKNRSVKKVKHYKALF